MRRSTILAGVRRHDHVPARNAPWVASERVDVSAAHARRGRHAVVRAGARARRFGALSSHYVGWTD
jgi:hypothetical protein